MLRTLWWTVALVVVATAVPDTRSQAPAPAGGRVLYQMDLQTFQPSVGTHCHATSGDGGVIVTSLTDEGDCHFYFDTNLSVATDYRVEVTLRIRQKTPPNGSLGVAFGRAGKRESYGAFALVDDRVVMGSFSEDKKWTGLVPVSPAPVARTGIGAVNKFTVDVRGREVTGFLNDQRFASGTSPVPVDGAVAMNVGAKGHEVLVTQFRVTALAPATTTMVVPAGQPTIVPAPAGNDFKLTPGGATLIDDDLSTTQRFAVSGTACTASYSDGGLLVVTNGPDGCEWELQHLNEVPTRARIELSMRFLKGDFAGLIVGYTTRADKLHYHANIIADGRVNLNLSQNGTSTPLIPWGPSAAVRTAAGATNRIAIEVLMQEIRFFINGQPVGRVTSPEVVQGGFGIFVGGPKMSAVFTNLKVTDLGQNTTLSREIGGPPPLRLSPAKPTESRNAEPRSGERLAPSLATRR